MGRGSQTERRGRLLFASVKNAKPNEVVHFELSSKASKEASLVPEGTEKSLSGKLIRAEHRKWEYQGEPKDSIVLYLADPGAGEEGETYRVEFALGSMGRSVINSLLNAQHFDDDRDIVTLRVYNNKKGYASIWVGLGIDGVGQAVQLPWKHSIDAQNSYITKEKKKGKDEKGKIIDKITNNYLELDSFLLEQFNNNVVSKMKHQPAPQAETVGVENNDVQSGAGDDLPF